MSKIEDEEIKLFNIATQTRTAKRKLLNDFGYYRKNSNDMVQVHGLHWKRHIWVSVYMDAKRRQFANNRKLN